jgi:hypothetical protein
MRSLILHSLGESPNPKLFDAFEDPRIPYSNNSFYADAAVSSSDIKSLIDQIGQLEEVTHPGASWDATLSLSMMVRLPLARGFVSILTHLDAEKLFARLRTVLRDGKAARAVFDVACRMGFREPGIPRDVSVSVNVEISDFHREAGRLVGTATIRNQSSAAIPGPLALIVKAIGENSDPANTMPPRCLPHPMNKPYIDVESAADGLAAGQETSVRVEFYQTQFPVVADCRCENDRARYCEFKEGECGGSNRCVCTPPVTLLAGPGGR